MRIRKTHVVIVVFALLIAVALVAFRPQRSALAATTTPVSGATVVATKAAGSTVSATTAATVAATKQAAVRVSAADSPPASHSPRRP